NEILLRIPDCRVHLVTEGEALPLATGDFELLRVSEENVALAILIRVGDEIRWPLTKDEPVVKLDASNYLFSLPIGDGNPITYAVSFGSIESLGSLDSFLSENSLFNSRCPAQKEGSVIDWKEFAPAIDDYNTFLGKAVAKGTGQIVKGVFRCSNAYANQVKRGSEKFLGVPPAAPPPKTTADKKSKASAINKTIKRARAVSKLSHKISGTAFRFVGIATGSVVTPIARSTVGKTVLSALPGEVALASLDSLNKILDAVEAAGKQAMEGSSEAVTRIVSNKLGESAGEATEDALATTGNCLGTVWNVFKIRKALNPASSVPGNVIRTVTK
ncbi:hypothetical protein M569_07274, partial [Genlisea aurea]